MANITSQISKKWQGQGGRGGWTPTCLHGYQGYLHKTDRKNFG